MTTMRITASVTLVSLLLFTSSWAIEQPKFEADVAATRRALQEGKIQEALAYHETKAREAEKDAASSRRPEPYWEAAFAAYQEAARAARLSGQVQKMLTHSDKALEMARKTGKPALELRAINGMIYAHTHIRNFGKVSQLMEQGLAIVQSLPSKTGARLYWEGAFYGHMGREHTRRREYTNAIEALSHSVYSYEGFLASLRGNSARIQSLQEDDRGSLLWHLTWLVNAYLQANKLQEAQEQNQRAFNFIKEWGFKYAFEGDLYRSMGEIYFRQNQFPNALESFNKALALAESQGDANRIRSASIHIGNLLLVSGQSAEAIAYYEKAIQQIESARSLLQSQEYRQSYFEGGVGAYASMIETLLVAGKQEEAFNFSERARSRTFLDILGSKVRLSRVKGDLQEEEEVLKARVNASVAAGLEDTATAGEVPSADLRKLEEEYDAFVSKARRQHKEQASLMSVEPLKLKEVQALLEPGQTLIQYFVAREKTFLWAIERDHFNALVVSITQKDLARKVDALRKSIAELKPVREYRSLARNVYELLIRPALSHIKGKELIIVPHGVLHYLPFQALYSAQGRYLVEDYAVSYLSSASLMQFTKEKRKARGDRVLAFGNPDLGDPTKELKFAELEAAEIKKLYPSSAVLLRKAATKIRAKDLWSQYDILHFAAHAELKGDDPLSSAILLAKGEGDEGRLQVGEVFEMDLSASLVVLSGCETGLGKLSSGDELVGLTRAFIYAGTPSVVASLWKVDDASTAHLMSSFYRNLKTKSKVESLRQAQLELIRGGKQSDLLARRGVGGIGKLGEVPQAKPQSPGSASVPVSISTSHPYFWAPFILVGDGK